MSATHPPGILNHLSSYPDHQEAQHQQEISTDHSTEARDWERSERQEFMFN